MLIGSGLMGGFLSILSEFSCLASVLCTCFSCTCICAIDLHAQLSWYIHVTQLVREPVVCWPAELG